MSDEPRQALREIIAKYGTSVCSDARRCAGLLKDYSAAHRRETNILVNALKERVPLDLLAAGNSQPRELLLSRLAKRLEENIALTAEAANWAVESWALALNLISDSEIKERENKRTELESERVQTSKTVSDFETENKTQKFPRDSFEPQLEPRQQPPVVKKPTQINQPPIFAPPPAAPPPVKTSGQASIQSSSTPIHPAPTSKKSAQTTQIQKPEPTAQTRPPKRSRKIRGCFIGCLLLLLLLSGLLFGVPYAFKVMRDTQQPSQPQFPSTQ